MTLDDHNLEEVIPIVEETLTLEKRTVQTGSVRVRTVVDEEQIMLTDELARDMVEIERVPMDLAVDRAPPDRNEGGVLVVSIVEERFVVEKRLFVVEEVRLRRTASVIPVEIPATRLVMRAEIERSGVVQPPRDKLD